MTFATSDLKQLPWMQSLIGKVFDAKDEVANRVPTTAENWNGWAMGIGETNPLFLDEDYAKKSRWGRLIPAPTWLSTGIRPAHAPMLTAHASNGGIGGVVFRDFEPKYDTSNLKQVGGATWIDDLRAFNGGVEWQFFTPPALGDRIKVAGQITEVIPKFSQSLGPIAVVWGEVSYHNQDGVLLASNRGYVVTYDVRNASAERSAENQQVEPAPPDQVLPIADALRSVKRRGPEPRYWEDVNVGDELPRLEKGTLDHAEIVAFGASYRGLPKNVNDLIEKGDYAGAAIAFREAAMASGLAGNRHADDSVAREEGAPGAFDIGEQRAGWACELVTDWAGDAAAVTKFSIQYRLFHVVGDTAWCDGRVFAKSQENGQNLVDIELWVENHRGQRVSTGTAQVALPSRS
jgi:acyl dehydratase